MIDLHIHTDHSDGTVSPAGVVRLAAAAGVSAIAVTDHEIMTGCAEAAAEGEKYGVRVIPGIEISTACEQKEIHIVGLFTDPDNRALEEECERIRRGRVERNLNSVRILREKGFDISEEELQALGSGRVLTKGNVAEIMVKKGYADNLNEAMTRYVGYGGIAYCDRYMPAPERAIELIHEAGGMAFVAHINQIDRADPDNAERIARLIISQGADGLETRYAEYNEPMRERADRIAEELGVLKSGGSDFHGTLKKGLSIGIGYGDLAVPDAYLEKLLCRAEM